MELINLCENIAFFLRDGWIVNKITSSDNNVVLTNRNHKKYFLSIWKIKNKLSISFSNARFNEIGFFSRDICVSTNKSAKVIANDIKRRILTDELKKSDIENEKFILEKKERVKSSLNYLNCLNSIINKNSFVCEGTKNYLDDQITGTHFFHQMSLRYTRPSSCTSSSFTVTGISDDNFIKVLYLLKELDSGINL